MRARTEGHCDIGAKIRTQRDVFFESSDCWKILVVSDSELFPGAALRRDITDGFQLGNPCRT
jgi:hypothetical protein